MPALKLNTREQLQTLAVGGMSWLLWWLPLAALWQAFSGTQVRADTKFTKFTKMRFSKTVSFDENNMLRELLQNIEQQINFETLVLFKPVAQQNCAFDAALGIMLDVPKLILQQEIRDFRYRFPKRTLVLRCEPQNWQEAGGLRDVLRDLRHVVQLNAADFANKNWTQPQAALKYCEMAFKAGIYHVIVVFLGELPARQYFICYKYPETTAKRRRLRHNESTIFESQFRNMQGATLWTQPDLRPGRSMVYNDTKGVLRMDGYVASLINLYAACHNATLRFRFPIDIDDIVSMTAQKAATRNGSLDIAASVAALMHTPKMDGLSYPYDVVNYCIMIPLPKPIHHYEVYTYIFTKGVFCVICLYVFFYSTLLLYSMGRLSWRTVFLNLEMVRAVLAQTFRTVPRPRLFTKFLIMQLSYASYLVANMYSAFLQSYLTHPPLTPLLETVPAVKRAGIKVLYPASEIIFLETVPKQLRKELATVLKLEPDFVTFADTRQAMDTRYIYPVDNRHWQIINENQKIFQRKIFYFNTQHCVHGILLLSFPLRPDLPYRERFDEFILRAHATGFVQHWTSMSFFVMARLDLLQLEDLSLPLIRADKTLNLGDFQLIWLGYGCLITISFLVFLLELAHRSWTKRRQQKKPNVMICTQNARSIKKLIKPTNY